MRHYLLFICILFFPFQFCLSQSLEETWKLRFSPADCYFETYCRVSIDSTQIADDGLHPIRLLLVHKKQPTYTKCQIIKPSDFSNLTVEDINEALNISFRGFDWSKMVVVPTNVGKNGCTVTLNCKSEIDSIRFYVTAFDKKEKELYTDSVLIPTTTQWINYSLAFHQKGVRAVRIIVRYKGEANANEGKSAYLNRIKITSGKRLLNDFPIDSLVRNKDVQLKTKAIIPLSYEDDASLAKIHDWKNKKIIALGDQLNGLWDLRVVQIQLMKQLITSENCKLILLDLPQDVCVRWNPYLQGKQSGEDQLFEELKCSLHNYGLFFDFLKWVRQYNAKSDVPVRVIGIDKFYDFGFMNQTVRDIYMADYLLELSTNREDSIYYVHAMHRNEYSQIKEHILQSEWSKTLNKQDFQYLLFLMDELIHVRTRSPFGKTIETEKELEKANRIEQIVNLYLSPTEKAVLIAPSEQINKRTFIPTLWHSTSNLLGSYLNQKYGKRYHAVNILIGERKYLVDTILPFTFERAALNTKNSYFYYPSSQLPKGILGLEEYNSFQYCHIPSHFDALVFAREDKSSQSKSCYRTNNLSKSAKNVIHLRLNALLK